MNIDNFSPGRIKFLKILFLISIVIFTYHSISMIFKLNWYYEDPAMLGWGWAALLLGLALRKWNLLILKILMFLPFILMIFYIELTRESKPIQIEQNNTFENYIDNLDGSFQATLIN
tara:strand:+ start:441 stop:791 length:351 start_codon:yes stop_codon:yes gene_type:complete